jgi:starch synthase
LEPPKPNPTNQPTNRPNQQTNPQSKPRYEFFGASPLLGGRQFEAEFDWGGTHIVVTSCIVEGLRVFFVDPHNGFFHTGSVYGRCVIFWKGGALQYVLGLINLQGGGKTVTRQSTNQANQHPLSHPNSNDDEMRFDFFCKAALEFLLQTQRQPDILHCHDWQTAHLAKAYWEEYHPYGLWKPQVGQEGGWLLLDCCVGGHFEGGVKTCSPDVFC